MPYEEFEEGRTIWRYMNFDKLEDLVTTGELYMPNAYAYEDTDINEGRIHQTYVDVIERALKIRAGLPWARRPEVIREIKQQVREELRAVCGLLKSTRANSFISCWTDRENEDRRMWQSFTSPGCGVAIRSTVGLVAEQLDDGCGLLDQTLMLDQGFIKYDRERLHVRLDLENIHNLTLPLFSLDGGARNYTHEREYRFVAVDQEGREDDLQIFTEAPPRGNIVSPSRRRVRSRRHFRHRHIKVPVDCAQMLLEVRLCPGLSARFTQKVTNLLERQQINCRITQSIFQ